MADKKYDSVLMGWAEDPEFNDSNELIAWRVKLKKHEVQEILDKYVTSVNSKGHGGNAYITLFMSASGKACCRVYDENSEGAKEYKKKQQEKAASVADDLPF